MLTTSIRRKILLLAIVLAIPWGSAASGLPESSRSARTFEQVPLEFFSRIWGLFRGEQSKEGCHIDPHGRCADKSAESSSPQRKAGCHIDPHGLCIP